MIKLTEHRLRMLLAEAYDKGREHGHQEQQERYKPAHHGKSFERHVERTKMFNSIAEAHGDGN